MGRRELDITTSVDEADRINHPVYGFEGGCSASSRVEKVAFRVPDVGPNSMMAYSWTHVPSFAGRTSIWLTVRYN